MFYYKRGGDIFHGLLRKLLLGCWSCCTYKEWQINRIGSKQKSSKVHSIVKKKILWRCLHITIRHLFTDAINHLLVIRLKVHIIWFILPRTNLNSRYPFLYLHNFLLSYGGVLFLLSDNVREARAWNAKQSICIHECLCYGWNENPTSLFI